jgi:hypothetical protein
MVDRVGWEARFFGSEPMKGAHIWNGSEIVLHTGTGRKNLQLARYIAKLHNDTLDLAQSALAAEVERLRFREVQLLSALSVIAHFPAGKATEGEVRTHEEWLVDKAKRAIETNDELRTILAKQKQEG